MCGIAGVFHRDERVDLGRLHHMSALLRHRGPHDEGMVLIDAAGGQTLTLGGASDTEVILASYRRWGLECLARFNGMFAFALWDAKERRLFCARDRFGVKPFYYEWNGRRFAFASEPRVLALTQSRRIAPRL